MANYIDERESKLLEFKEIVPKFSALIKTCVAFANGVGGEIIIGVEDGTGKIIGISEQDREKMYEEFLDCLYDSTQPALLATLYEKSYGEKSLLIVKITPASKKPCYVKAEGIPKGVYLRVGSHTRVATPEYIEDLMRETRRIAYDEEPICDKNIVLSKEILSSVYGKVAQRQLLADHVLKISDTNHAEVFPTVAGVLFFSEDEPSRYIPEASVMCTEFKGTEGREIIMTRELTGTIPQLVSQTLLVLQEVLERNFVLKGPRLTGSMPVPDEALREALINALIHRKYTIAGPVKVAIWKDRLEIFSPGCFPGLVDIAHLGDGTTCLRNPHLAQLARKFKLIEKLGTGIKLMLDSCAKAGLDRPLFKEDGDFVKVIFRFPDHYIGSMDPETLILKIAEKKKTVLVSDVCELLHVSRNTATRKLSKLVELGKLLRRGKGPSVHYVLR
ncbi:MAG: putative DNA binding domain-containing protein [Verrucomicrobia bacterium]|nr:putative DNA binding domain-containing protein [Verrucomicrobiota bacterium]